MDKSQIEWAVKSLPDMIESHWAHRHEAGCSWLIQEQVRMLREARKARPGGAPIGKIERVKLTAEQMYITDMWAIIGTSTDEDGMMCAADVQVCSFKDACDIARSMAEHEPDLTFSVYPLRAAVEPVHTIRAGR